MNDDKSYITAVSQAEERISDIKERGAAAIGSDALKFMDSLMTEEEIAESDLRVSLIGELINARQEI